MHKIYASIALTWLSSLVLAACGTAAVDSDSRGSALEGGPDSSACAQAFEPNTPGKVCNATLRGLCFESDEAACECAGCPLGADGSSCLIAESYPTQVSCDQPSAPTPDDDTPTTDCGLGFAPDSNEGVCNATYEGMCFESDSAACECAGCPIDSANGCLIAESYPTQIFCP